jgi:SAM-dependent methyltransferase
MTTFQRKYVGSELGLFEKAVHWKSYFGSMIREYMVGAVLEVGAGIGGTTRVLCDGQQTRWTALEPDPQLADTLNGIALEKPFRTPLEIIVGTIQSLASSRMFDAIIYIDVLEHIEDDVGEMRRATRHLKPNGVLIVLSPAQQWLYSEFDEAVGHVRRYTAGTLGAVVPGLLRREKLLYLDSVGVLASVGNRLFLRRSLPDSHQIRLWDRVFVRLSRLVDPALGYRVGKSILGVWRKPAQ